jgi:apolipoprotein N-acyltransferase
MKQVSYRLVTTVVLFLSVALWCAAAAGASRYIDRPGTGGVAQTPVTYVGVESARPGGFDWADAGIGAATAVGVAILAAGAYIVVLRRRRSAAFS